MMMTSNLLGSCKALNMVAVHPVVQARTVALVGDMSDWAELYRDGKFSEELEEHIFQGIANAPVFIVRIWLTELEARQVLAQAKDLYLDIKRESA